jgi:hypothetical protein
MERITMSIVSEHQRIKKSKRKLSKKFSIDLDEEFQNVYSEVWFQFIQSGGYKAVEKEFERRLFEKA